jgi:hypothetical protein
MRFYEDKTTRITTMGTTRFYHLAREDTITGTPYCENWIPSKPAAGSQKVTKEKRASGSTGRGVFPPAHYWVFMRLVDLHIDLRVACDRGSELNMRTFSSAISFTPARRTLL